MPAGTGDRHAAAASGASVAAEVVARLRDGDEAAFEAVFRAYAEPLCAFAVRYVGSRDVAADLVQDVFLWIWRNRAEWTIQGSLKAYLYRAVRNRALGVVRHHRIERRWAEESTRDKSASGVPAPASGDETRDEQLAALERAVAALPSRRRQVFLLRWRDELSYAEIAEVMATSVKTVENQMARALRAIRHDVRGGFPPRQPS